MPDECKTLFVKNLPYELSEDDIGDRFRKYGLISSVRKCYNAATKQFKGFCYIDFETHEAAKNSLEGMNGKQIKGRAIIVDFDTKQGKAKKSYRPNLEKTGNKFYNKKT